MEKEVLLIERLHIDGFWGKHTLDINFSKDVNILTGNNGIGKTTVLNIIYYMLTGGQMYPSLYSKLSCATLYMSDDSYISMSVIDEKNIEWEYVLAGQPVDREVIQRRIRQMAISNFDTTLPDGEQIDKAKAKNPNIHTDMDFVLSRWIEYYNQYMSGISARVSRMLSTGNSISDFSNMYSYYNKMQELCNEFFAPTKEWHVNDEGRIEFLLSGYDKVIPTEELSSGEKQILSLLLSTLIQNGKPGVIFWDEPEISLHVWWQRKLIRMLRTLNPNMQLIIATHAPNILYEGWEGNVIKLKKSFDNEQTDLSCNS